MSNLETITTDRTINPETEARIRAELRQVVKTLEAENGHIPSVTPGTIDPETEANLRAELRHVYNTLEGGNE